MATSKTIKNTLVYTLITTFIVVNTAIRLPDLWNYYQVGTTFCLILLSLLLLLASRGVNKVFAWGAIALMLYNAWATFTGRIAVWATEDMIAMPFIAFAMGVMAVFERKSFFFTRNSYLLLGIIAVKMLSMYSHGMIRANYIYDMGDAAVFLLTALYVVRQYRGILFYMPMQLLIFTANNAMDEFVYEAFQFHVHELLFVGACQVLLHWYIFKERIALLFGNGKQIF